jgi:hypothetical protein
MLISAAARSVSKRILAVFLLMVFLGMSLPALASTVGVLSGTITGTANKLVDHATINAVSPSGSYKTTTDARGFFSITGVQQDTYTVSVMAPGYEAIAVTGVTVSPDQTTPFAITMSATIKNIGRAASRSTTSAYQPALTTDTYTLGTQQIATQLGKKGQTSESSLLASLPGASLDSSGYPVLRGGRENEEGFQFEGIDYTDAFTNQFVNSLSLNNPGGFQLTPGAGDASSGNSGTGVINLLLKRGTYPAFGSAEFDSVVFPFTHQLSTEYGFATPNGRFSNYFTFTGENQFAQIGAYGSAAIPLNAFNSRTFSTRRDVANVMTYKFGKDNGQKIEFVYQNQEIEFLTNYAGLPPNFKTNDPFELSSLVTGSSVKNAAGASVTPPLTIAQIQSLITLYPGQSSATAALNILSGDQQPNETYKFQYSISPNAASYLSAKYYQVNAVTFFESPFTGLDNFGSSTYSLQGGKRTGFQLDGTYQVNDKNLLKFGGKYELVQPIFDAHANGEGLFAIGADSRATNAAGAPIPEILDFLPGGYLAQHGFASQLIPEFVDQAAIVRHDKAFYADNTFSPNSKTKIDLGLRLDATDITYPNGNAGTFLFSPAQTVNGVYQFPSNTKDPMVLQPRVATSYQLDRNNTVRFAYSRSVEMPPLAFVDEGIGSHFYSSLPYANLAPTAAVCGNLGNATCANYGQQLFWENQLAFNGNPLVQPLKPETFTNYEMSFSHQFGGNVAAKITPYFRRGYDALVSSATVKTDVNGAPLISSTTGAFLFNPPIDSNLGIEKTTGVELYITKDNPGPGFSGSFSANYINEFSSVIPLTGSEDFFPSIPAQSLILGNVYRVGFLSPFNMTAAISYKTRGGFRINPILSYNEGYPINFGNITSMFLGTRAFNVPNTNVTSSFGSTSTPNYVDTQNPGSVFKPNIAATRGTPESPAAGGILSAQRMTASMSFEFSPPSQNGKGGTYGLFISNLFNQLYGQPTLNTRWQPVANGIGGPQSGQTALAQTEFAQGQFNFTQRAGNQPYLLTPNGSTQTIGSGPRTLRFYYQLAF